MSSFTDRIKKGTDKEIKPSSGMGWKTYRNNALFSGAIYGGLSVLTSDPNAAADEKIFHYGKFAAAATADIVADAGMGVVANKLMGMGKYGKLAGGAIWAFNIGGGLLGLDAGTGVLAAADKMGDTYNSHMAGGKDFQVTESMGKTMQRQIANLTGTSSNMAEIMHNAVDNFRDIPYDMVPTRKQHKWGVSKPCEFIV